MLLVGGKKGGTTCATALPMEFLYCNKHVCIVTVLRETRQKLQRSLEDLPSSLRVGILHSITRGTERSETARARAGLLPVLVIIGDFIFQETLTHFGVECCAAALLR